MSQKEKEWVVKIQLLQLQSPDPANDDYYYQVMLRPLCLWRRGSVLLSHSRLLSLHYCHITGHFYGYMYM